MFPSGSPAGAAADARREHDGRRRSRVEGARSRLLLAPFSTRLPPELIERLRVAAPHLHQRQGEIAAIAIDRYLHEHGY
jgi:hypothetical protein